MRLERIQAFLDGDPDDRVGRYELLRELGRGGSAVVFEALDPALGRRVAIKVLREGSPERLRQEAAAAAQLRHPDIVAIHEIGPRFIVMDLIEGRTLADALPALDRAARLRILETVARAVGYAHDQGVIHRDLKPANVLVQPDGRPVLTDFGLARVGDGRGLTLPGSALGTPGYMAPEQGRGGSVGPAADVWALGVMLYEMESGRPPFDGGTPLAVFERSAREDPPRLPGPAGDVAARAMQKDPRRRYETAAAFADDVARLARGERPAASALRARQRAARIGALALGALTAVTAGAAILGRPAAPPPAPAAASAATLRERWRHDERRFSRRIEQEPRNVDLLIDRARTRRFRAEHDDGTGRNPEPDFAAAESDVRRALEIDPQSKLAHLQLAILSTSRAHHRRENGADPGPDLARAEQALARAGDVRAARTYRGVARLERGLARRAAGEDGAADFGAALGHLTPPEYPRARMFRARVLAELGRYDEAEAEYAAYFAGQRVDLQEEAYKVWHWRALARRAAGDLATAERYLGEAIARNRENATLWLRRADVRYERARWAEAAGDYQRAFAINPTLEVLAAERAAEAERRKR
jgi:tetratricopeptide (TPR) repeat protein/predicted Ser/Thr protein kinase